MSRLSLRSLTLQKTTKPRLSFVGSSTATYFLIYPLASKRFTRSKTGVGDKLTFAANSLVVVVRNIGTVFCFGIASAGGILLGNVMGQGDLERSKRYASKTLKLTVIAGAFGGLIVLAITPFIMKFASLTPTAMHYLKYMLLINCYYVMGTAVNTTLIAGVFRAGGDTKFGLICDTIDMWVYAVPLGFFAAFVLKLPVMWVYFLLCTDEFVKWPWVIKRYLSGKWAKNITREDIFENNK